MISQTTQAILLMTARFPGGPDGGAEPLTLAEWNGLAGRLESKGLTPGRLTAGTVADLLGNWRYKSVTPERLESLLERGAALALSSEKWERSGLWTVTRYEPDYPENLRDRLKERSPVLFFGCGNRSLLDAPGLAVVGSRNADAKSISYGALLGAKAAENGRSVISGGARGVDEAAMFGSLLSGGTAVGVLANGLMSACLSQKYREYLMDGKLALISPYGPEAGFRTGNAMGRNKYVYCLSRAAVVVHSAREKGGTLSGALENLRNRWVRLWVRNADGAATGNARLAEQGASRLPKRMEEIDFSGLFAEEAAQDSRPVSYEAFLEKLRSLCASEPLGLGELAEAVQVERKRLNDWLKRAAAEDRIKKRYRPVRYSWNDKKIQGELYPRREKSVSGSTAGRPGGDETSDDRSRVETATEY